MMSLQSIHNFITAADRRILGMVLGIILSLISVVIGISLAIIGPIYTVILIIALAGGVWIVAGIENAIWSVVAIITLLPFSTLPFKIVLTPTFLDVALVVVFFLYIGQWMVGERRRFATSPVHPFLLLFIVLSIFSFVAGLRYAGLTSRVIRSFAELVLSMIFTLVLVDIISSVNMLKRLIAVVLITGGIAALIGVVLWFTPDQLAEQILVRLSIIGYPDGGVIQYIEQNPELLERAIGTAVNPNALGGMLVMVGALAAPQIITQHPITGKRWHIYPILFFLVLCLILTFSRGSMLAFAVAVMFIAALEYRKVLLLIPIVILLLLILPWSQEYIERFIAGFQGADLATQMRFGEYQDALRLIERYPLLGVGFAGTPDIDIYLGVASVYFTLAGNMGLLGVGAFFVLMAALFTYAWRARPHLDSISGMRPIWLGLLAALISALFNGIFDHYFFNLEFHSAITIFWLFVGMTLAATRLTLQEVAID